MIITHSCKHCHRTMLSRTVTVLDTDYRYSLCPHCDFAQCLQCGSPLDHHEMVCTSCDSPV